MSHHIQYFKSLCQVNKLGMFMCLLLISSLHNTATAQHVTKPSGNYEQVARIPNEVFLRKHQFNVSYNTFTLCPNYVSWVLTKDMLRGNAQRSNKFVADESISSKYRVDYFDYNGSGYDRGHMCPAGDNKNSQTAMDATFQMTNICPQNHGLNAGDWNELENQCRYWARNYGKLYIVCGPVFYKSNDANRKRIGKRKNLKVSVPDGFFKVILSMGKEPKAIGFIYPNKNGNKDIRDYAVSVDEVERLTGFDFFYNLDDNVEKRIEKECKPSAWGI